MMPLPKELSSAKGNGKEPAGEWKNHPAFQGLCVNCMDAESCMFCRQAKTPILHCEEYKPCERIRCHPGPKREGLPTREEALAMLREPVDLKGLCMNCENRFGCTFPKPPGGVWHCSEYR